MTLRKPTRTSMRTFIFAASLALLLLTRGAHARPDSNLVPALNRLAESNNAEAIYHLGMAYHLGSGVERDPAKALTAFRRAARLGDPLGAYKLGCYYDGQGAGLIKTDLEVALRYKLVAAKAGYALAQQDVANIYASKGDFVSALAWLEKAAAQGSPDALATYASVYNGAPGVAKDKVKTASYFRLFLDRTEPSEKQQAWLKTFERDMTADERTRADQLVRTFRPKPTPLTLKALSGLGAAEELVARAKRK
jgi:TPR repeat protein